MDKINRKEKLIGIIAISLIVVILTILITTNLIIKNNKLSNEGYFTTIANANSNLVAGYIKKGITIGGVEGTLEVLDTSDATAKEEDIAWGKTGYVNGIKITGTRIDTVAQGKEAQQEFMENKTLIDDYGNKVVVPQGFKIASDSSTTVTGGVVIEDVLAGDENTKGSQFVWVPVGNIITDNNGTIKTVTLGRYTFDASGKEKLEQNANNCKAETAIIINYTTTLYPTYYYQELLKTTTSANRKAKDIEDFVNKTLNSGGYYIGRYELGDSLAKDSPRIGTQDVSNPNNPITCKSGVYPYTYINQADASELCKGMYKSSSFDSDLINSYAWDTALVFIQTFSRDTNYSVQTPLQKTLAKCGEASDGIENDVRCNIYDMAGNTYEYSTETNTTNVNFPYVARGGSYNDGHNTSSRPTGGMRYSNNGFSARPILYLQM